MRLTAKPGDGHVHELSLADPVCLLCGTKAPKLRELVLASVPTPPRPRPIARPEPSRLAAIDPRLAPSMREPPPPAPASSSSASSRSMFDGYAPQPRT